MGLGQCADCAVLLQVTLIGQSSGGTDILALLSSSFSTGLFSGAISLSGSPNITMDLHTTQTQDSQFLANVSPPLSFALSLPSRPRGRCTLPWVVRGSESIGGEVGGGFN